MHRERQTHAQSKKQTDRQTDPHTQTHTHTTSGFSDRRPEYSNIHEYKGLLIIIYRIVPQTENHWRKQ